ncbi:hypothetical protein [Metabacillus fastidiosus]|uniref:hypothetical protein n=1 Tax=Metabacillus fastidiosus TaxID=1458 RepID=UPI003D2AD524
MNYKRNMVPQMPIQGWHFATIMEIKEGKQAQTKMGLSDTILATFQTDHNCIVSQSLLMAPGVNFILEKLINIVIGEGSDEVDLKNLVKKRCGIKVEHKLWKDRIFANVIDVCSVDELQEDDTTHELTDIDELDLI